MIPEGHGVMDKALACHTGGRGLNAGQDQELFCFRKIKKCAPIPPSELSLSHNACHHVLQREYLSQGGKKRGF